MDPFKGVLDAADGSVVVGVEVGEEEEETVLAVVVVVVGGFELVPDGRAQNFTMPPPQTVTDDDE